MSESVILADSSASVVLNRPSRIKMKTSLSQLELCGEQQQASSFSHQPNYKDTLSERAVNLQSALELFHSFSTLLVPCLSGCLGGVRSTVLY